MKICPSKTGYLVSKWNVAASYFMSTFDSKLVGIRHVHDLDDEEYYLDKTSAKFKCYRLPNRMLLFV